MGPDVSIDLQRGLPDTDQSRKQPEFGLEPFAVPAERLPYVIIVRQVLEDAVTHLGNSAHATPNLHGLDRSRHALGCGGFGRRYQSRRVHGPVRPASARHFLQVCLRPIDDFVPVA